MNTQPNIILMIAHDLGRHIGPYGHASNCTPNLNQLATESIQLDAHFATSPGCSPSRASLITGQYPHTNGQFGLAHLGWDLYRDHPTLPQSLADANYNTALFGIWHLHKHTTAGFAHVEPDHSTRDSSPDAYAAVAATRVENWFDKHHNPEKPFYLHVGFWETHRPFRGHAPGETDPDNWTDPDPSTLTVPNYLPNTQEARQEIAELHTAIQMLDTGVGRVLAALEKSGAASNTIVLFTADHGLPFQRAKGTLYNQGIAIPLIARWPNHITPGSTSPALSSNIDIMPTLLEAANLPIPPSTQGQSILPILLGQTNTPTRDAVYSEKSYHEHYDPIRSVRTEHYTYIRNFADRPNLVMPSDVYNSPTRQSTTDDEALWSHRPQEELYDLAADPSETHNLINDPAHQAALLTMRDKLDIWLNKTNDPILKGPIPRPTPESN